MLHVVHGPISARQQALDLERAVRELPLSSGSLYFGYPIVPMHYDPTTVHALLTSESLGLVVFDFTASQTDEEALAALDRMHSLILAIKSKLIAHKDLTENHDLKIPVTFVFFVPATDRIRLLKSQGANAASSAAELKEVIPSTTIDQTTYKALSAAVQHVSTMKPRKKRLNVRRQDSRGGLIRSIERQVANLDAWQSRGAIENPEGPQRIRGLAGSGKTVVLALKAAYLHAQNPEWTIAVTYYTRSLRDTIVGLIRRFYYELVADEPDWSRLMVMNSWGGSASPGVYTVISAKHGIPWMSLTEASSRFGKSRAFAGACDALREAIKVPSSTFDAILIDEAQDFDASFFRLCYHALPEPKRLVWAYDELQSLTDLTMPPLAEIFGTDHSGRSLVDLKNEPGSPHQDVILRTCYRNTPWCLTVAHGLGFGVFRKAGLIQGFEDPSMWTDIGYEVMAGTLQAGESVRLRRAPDSTPSFFEESLDPNEAVRFISYERDEEQLADTAKEISRILRDEEVDPGDFAVIFPDVFTAQKRALQFKQVLESYGVAAHVVGVTHDKDTFFVEGSVAVSGIHRAKGNEAPIVYVMDAQASFEGGSLIPKRNALFSAMTRARAWVTVSEVSQGTNSIKSEYDEIKAANFELPMQLPDAAKLKMIRAINRDRQPADRERDRKDIKLLQDTIERIKSGDLPMGELPTDLRELLRHLTDEK